MRIKANFDDLSFVLCWMELGYRFIRRVIACTEMRARRENTMDSRIQTRITYTCTGREYVEKITVQVLIGSYNAQFK